MTSLDLAMPTGPAIGVHPDKVGATPPIREVRLRAITQPVLSPGAFALSDSWGQYKISTRRSALGSILAHVVFLGAIAAFWFMPHEARSEPKPVARVILIAPSLESYALPLATKQAGGGGGGGDRDKIEAPRGELPRAAKEQITPPQIVLRNEHPRLTAEATVIAPPQIRMAATTPNLGNPAAPILPSIASNGLGSAGGIGSGAGGGVGKGAGAGVGEGYGGGIGGGAYKVGGSVLAPRPLTTPDPDYTEQARQAKLQGMCVLGLIVGADGKPRDIHVIRKLGLGLDEKAMIAVSQWTFAPATKDGTAVPVQISVQVSFKLN
ncbi:MAG: energy transducer TonB [Candidatus Sulfotelmatobacter sp.]|jgi:periplasmic protein TonB